MVPPTHWSRANYGYRPPRKVRQSALKIALSLFAKEERLLVVDAIELAEKKTKVLVQALGKLEVSRALVVDSADNENLQYSIRNIKGNQFLPPEGVNVYDLLRHRSLVVTKDAAKALEARCLK